MALVSLVSAVSAWFAAREVPATAVYGERARPAQGNAKSGTVGGRASFLWTGKAKYLGPGWLGPRQHDDTIAIPGLIALVNDVRARRLAHFLTSAPVHTAPTSFTVPAAATTLIEAIDLGNALRLVEIEHHAGTAHATTDEVHVITAPPASSASTLRTLALSLQTQGNAHDHDATVHATEDADHDSSQADPLCLEATSKTIAQLAAEIEVEVYAYDDSAPTNDAAQFAAWLALHEHTLNAVRSYARGVHKFDRTEPATKVIHVRRGFAALCYFTLPIPVHELPATTPQAVTVQLTAQAEFPQGATNNGAPIDSVLETVLETDIT